MDNATEYFPNSWQLLQLGYLGDPQNVKFGHPASPGDASEEGIFRLRPFSGTHDLPADYEEASSRLQYVALNLLRVDAGNPMFGSVAAIFSPSLWWQGAIAASGIDSGIYTLCCNQTYLGTNGSVHVPCQRIAPTLLCHAGEPTPGVFGAMDHALLNNHLMWGVEDNLVKVLSQWHGDVEPKVTLLESTFFIEANVLGNALYAERDMKLLVGSFGPLFGTTRGSLLRDYAARHGLALAWALGPGLTNVSNMDVCTGAVSFAPQMRLLDVSCVDRVNASAVSSGAKEAPRELRWPVAQPSTGGFGVERDCAA